MPVLAANVMASFVSAAVDDYANDDECLVSCELGKRNDQALRIINAYQDGDDFQYAQPVF